MTLIIIGIVLIIVCLYCHHLLKVWDKYDTVDGNELDELLNNTKDGI